jgi:hypothetical protein
MDRLDDKTGDCFSMAWVHRYYVKTKQNLEFVKYSMGNTVFSTQGSE